MKASDIGFKRSDSLVQERRFRECGDQRYALEVLPAGIVFNVERLRRSSHELVGEVQVTVNGNFPQAKTILNGILSLADLNFTSAQARSTRAKLLSERSQSEGIDWHGLVEEFVVRVIAAERAGKPGIVLADVPELEDKAEVWDVNGLPILQDLPMVLFGDGSSGKSYLALWAMGCLAQQQGINILYADWEFAALEHKKRMRRLFEPIPRNIIYARCDRSLREETDRLSRLIQEHKCQYLVCDSIGFAVDGPAEAHEGASAYFRYLRQFGIGSLNIAHMPKHIEEGKDASIFGSVFFRNGARSVWFAQRTFDNPQGEMQVGLYHRKSNVGELLTPRGYKFVFDRYRTRVETVDVEAVDELAAALPLLERMKKRLQRGALSVKALAEDLNTSAASIRVMLARHESTFIRVGAKIALKNGEAF